MAILGAVAAATLLLLHTLGSVNSEVCVGELPSWEHGVLGEFCIIDQTTIVIRNFYYDGGGPDAHLYWYPEGYVAIESQLPRSGTDGSFIPHPNSNNNDGRFPQGGYVLDATLQFTLPDGVYACDMAVVTIWCRWARSHFTGIDIPPSTFTDSISVAVEQNKILCTRTQNETTTDEPPTTVTPPTFEFANCESLHVSLRLEWTVDRSSQSVLFRLCGCTSPDTADDNTWLGFGLSGSDTRTLMVGADATIVWVDRDNTPHAEDYYLSDYIPCGRGKGACPDEQSAAGECSNDATLISGSIDGREQCVVFSRNFSAGDVCDQTIDPDKENQYIVWGVGGLGDTAFRHFIQATKDDSPLHLGREPSKNCAPLVCPRCKPYTTQTLVAPTDATFVARIGPSGNQRGYMGITGRAGWGITWFINDTLIPTLVVQRGKTYTFVVYGGDDSDSSSKYHPFYITSSESGGILLGDTAGETVYAGFNRAQGSYTVGPLCRYTSTPASEAVLGDCQSELGDYQAILVGPESSCGQGTLTNTFTWTPDSDTPDLVYYQCASHRNLGWKIRVTDSNDGDKSNNDGDKFNINITGSAVGAHSSVYICVLAMALFCLLN